MLAWIKVINQFLELTVQWPGFLFLLPPSPLPILGG